VLFTLRVSLSWAPALRTPILSLRDRFPSAVQCASYFSRPMFRRYKCSWNILLIILLFPDTSSKQLSIVAVADLTVIHSQYVQRPCKLRGRLTGRPTSRMTPPIVRRDIATTHRSYRVQSLRTWNLTPFTQLPVLFRSTTCLDVPWTRHLLPSGGYWIILSPRSATRQTLAMLGILRYPSAFQTSGLIRDANSKVVGLGYSRWFVWK
jgi:hypothetical protein